LVQEALLAVARAVDRWVPDAQRGRFRAWLYRIARNLTTNFLTRPKHRVWGTGDTDMHRLLEAECDMDLQVTRTFEIEYHREVFRWAAERVQSTVKQNTWQAFWLSTIDDLPVTEVARKLGMSVGSVYIARSRVMTRLRDEVRRIEALRNSDS
jgi:RNA polymerase sigma-70 factor (ECF subfamily)